MQNLNLNCRKIACMRKAIELNGEKKNRFSFSLERSINSTLGEKKTIKKL